LGRLVLYEEKQGWQRGVGMDQTLKPTVARSRRKICGGAERFSSTPSFAAEASSARDASGNPGIVELH
jgi:hypothetical protein